MNFLAPWFLLGAAAIAGPIVFHLIRRSARERVSFSSLLFLRPTPPRATRRRKFEHVILLLLRCLGVMLLAIGFSRPFLPQSIASPPETVAGRQTVVLLDTSASMRREDLWPKALKIARRYLDQATPADRVAVLTFDQQPRTLISFSEWNAWPLDQRHALAESRLQSAAPTWAGTQLGLALTTGAEQFTEAGLAEMSGPRDVVLVSDLQEGARLDGLQGHDWPKGVHVILERVDPARPGAVGMDILDTSSDEAAVERQARVRIVNTKDSGREKFQIGWKEGGKSEDIYLPPGQTRTFLAPALPTNAMQGALVLSGGFGSYGETAYFVPSEVTHVNVAYFGAESPNDAEQLRYYLSRAFPDASRRVVSIVSTSNSVADANFAVVPSLLDVDQIKLLRPWIENGKTALLILTNVASGPTLAALLHSPSSDISESSGDYALLGDIDFTHPIFAPFADPQFSDFSHIHFWKHRRWAIPPNLSARILAKFDDGSPALAQIPIGKGNLLVFTAGWNPADSQLALSSKFLPLMQTMLDWSGGAAFARTQFHIGDAQPNGGGEFKEPGVVGHDAVNIPLDESRVTPLSPDDFGRLGVPLISAPEVPVAKTAEVRRRALQEELESRQKLWRWLLVGLLGVALVEILLGGWLSKRVATYEVTA